MSDDRDDETHTPKGIGLGYVIYQQVAGVLGAFALIAFLEHLFDVDWRVPIASMIAAWKEIVRPAIGWVLDKTVITLASWLLKWKIEIPLVVRDYLSVGIVYYFSAIRVGLPRLRWLTKRYGRWNALRFVIDPPTILTKICLWPFYVLSDLHDLYFVTVGTSEFLSRGNIKGKERHLRQNQLRVLLTLAPLLYLALLLAANYLLLKPGT